MRWLYVSTVWVRVPLFMERDRFFLLLALASGWLIALALAISLAYFAFHAVDAAVAFYTSPPSTAAPEP